MDPSFDTWTSLFLIAAGQGCFLSVLLFLKKEIPGSRYLGWIILLFSFTLVEYVAFWTGYRFEFPHINALSDSFAFLFGPLFYFYIRNVLGSEPTSGYQKLLHGIPALGLIIYRTPYYLLDAETKVGYLSGELSVPTSEIQQLFIVLIPWLKILSMLIYGILAWRTVRSRATSMPEGSLNRITIIHGFFLGFVAAYASYFIMVNTIGYVLIYDYGISLAMSAFIYCIGYLSFSQGLRFEVTGQAKYRNSTLDEEQIQELSRKVKDLTIRKKLYLRRELGLDELAEEVGTTRHNLSQILNDQIGKSFSEFINELRVGEAKKILTKENLNLNMLGVAYESGFNNKASFNNSFKRYTGQTPSQYRKTHLRKSVKSD